MMDQNKKKCGYAVLLLLVIIIKLSPFQAFSSTGQSHQWIGFDSFTYQGVDKGYEKAPGQGKYRNPILAGFYPDPSICRVGKDYYLVNSTFGYFPGIPIFQSRDLVNWKQIGHVINRPGQLNYKGLGVSRGIFAPAITYREGTFYVVCTMVDGGGNFVVTATDPAGPWSDPVYLNFDGIDPSLFFDDDGRAWMVNNGGPEKKPLYNGHRAIWIQEFDPSAKKMIGPRKVIVDGGVDISEEPIWIEGPHIYKYKGIYYLCCAEGGTGPGHSQVIFRSKKVGGPYIPWDKNPILTQRDLDPDLSGAVTCTGHADLVIGPDGKWWSVFLGVRPYEGSYSPMGRETFMLPVNWTDDDWPVILPQGDRVPLTVNTPHGVQAKRSAVLPLNGNFTWKDEFNSNELSPLWIMLREPGKTWWKIDSSKGQLKILPGKESLTGKDNPSYMARRIQHSSFTASTVLETPEEPGISAGLAVFQSENHHYFLAVNNNKGRTNLYLEQVRDGKPKKIGAATLTFMDKIRLRVDANNSKCSFKYMTEGGNWKTLVKDADAKMLTTAAAGGFVGATVGPHARVDKKVTAAKLNSDNTVRRDRISINEGWKFFKYESAEDADDLIYDVRPEVNDYKDDKPADSMPTKAEKVNANQKVLKPWILPSGNDFIKNPAKHHFRPEGNPGSSFAFVQSDFDDSTWEEVNLPHDWAIKGPFYQGWDVPVSGGMGRLPSPGVAWYRKALYISKEDSGKSVFLDVDGAMSYAMVWLNGNLVGGWPFGYSSWRLDLTPYIVPGGDNQIAIRLDNPPDSSRWYPGGGIYRNVWLVKTNPVHVGHWGTYITASEVSGKSAKVNLEITIDNDSETNLNVEATTQIFAIDSEGGIAGNVVESFAPIKTNVEAGKNVTVKDSVIIENPKLWGPPPTQVPNRYMAVTSLKQDGKIIDRYETRFGIRSLLFDPDKGIYINGERIQIKGVNQHHDLGALGAAFNTRAAERQLEILQEMGCNSIRTAHNPPAPELLELTDRMGFLVVDESFDVWERKKAPLDFHLIFPDWHEQDLRTLVRRDRNHPSVIMWSFGNEVGEQYTDKNGAELGKRLSDIIKEEDPTRPTTASMNWAKPDMPFPFSMDVININYQGEGIRQDPVFEGTNRIRTKPLYNEFHRAHPDKVVLSSETASALSSRGIFLFPVYTGLSTYVKDGRGGDSVKGHVSDYGLYAMDWGASPDKVFSSVERHPFVAGEFVWTGWDYLGEPSPYYSSRSSYFGMIDLAGFRKSRYYLYQAHWRPDLKMACIIPHWNWPDREGKVTPVHVFTSGDEAELFLNGESLGRKRKGKYEYRLRWDDVKYKPGEIKVVSYRKGEKWAEDTVKTTGKPARLKTSVDRAEIKADGQDLSFITVRVVDKNGETVPTADNLIKFSIEGPGDIAATDNGDPTDFTPFPYHERKAFNGLALVIVRSNRNISGSILITAESPALEKAQVNIISINGK